MAFQLTPSGQPTIPYEGQLQLDSVSTEPLAGQVDNLDVPNQRSVGSILLNASGDFTLTGVAGVSPNKVLRLINQSAFTCTIAANTGSLAARQFAAATTIPSGNFLDITYNSSLAKWVPAATSSSSGSGTVTSVGLTAPAVFSVSGSPVTTSGTLAFQFNGVQGDLIYGSAANTLTVLNKNTTASRYLSNSGVNNNPAWAQIDLTNGVTGILPAANGGTGVANANTITLGGNISTAGALITSGANSLTLTTTGPTNVTLPTSGTLSTTSRANPSVTIGLTVTNGSAATFMSSDSAPALSQAIVPTWTGIHTWSLAEPRLLLNETDAAADEKLWDIDLNNKTLKIRTRTDIDGTGVDAISVTRGTGTALSSITLGANTSASNLNVSATSVPTTGIYRPGLNRLGFSSSGTQRGEFNATGQFSVNTGYLPDAGGLKHSRISTGSISAGSSALVTVTWGTAFADANYTVVCSVLDTTAASLALSVVHIESQSASAITVRVQNTSAGALTGTLHVIAIHD